MFLKAPDGIGIDGVGSRSKQSHRFWFQPGLWRSSRFSPFHSVGSQLKCSLVESILGKRIPMLLPERFMERSPKSTLYLLTFTRYDTHR